MILHRSDKGFTLLEVMVALAIIATALITLLGSHLMSLNLAYKHKQQTLAAMLARQRMEENLTIPFDSLSSDFGDFAPARPEIQWETEVEEAEMENLKKVKIIIRLPDGDFELETLVARTLIE